MADSPSDRRSTSGPPRWVKVSGIIALVLVLLVVVMLLVGGGPGEHGPGRHLGSDGAARVTPSADAGGQTRPSGVPYPAGSATGSAARVEHGSQAP